MEFWNFKFRVVDSSEWVAKAALVTFIRNASFKYNWCDHADHHVALVERWDGIDGHLDKSGHGSDFEFSNRFLAQLPNDSV